MSGSLENDKLWIQMKQIQRPQYILLISLNIPIDMLLETLKKNAINFYYKTGFLIEIIH